MSQNWVQEQRLDAKALGRKGAQRRAEEGLVFGCAFLIGPTTGDAVLLSACLIILGLPHTTTPMENPIRLAEDGWFRDDTGKRYVPLGGFHGNVIPMDLLDLTDEERGTFEPHLWEGHIDLFDATESVLHQWFAYLSDNGVNSLRLFPRARVGVNVLDLCGKVNPDLQAAFQRAFTIAERYGIRFLLQIMPEPGRTGYHNRDALLRTVVPQCTHAEIQNLIPAQRRFVVEQKTVQGGDYFTDPDVLACQKLYLDRVLEWVANEPQIFALEIYNEQGWDGAKINGEWSHVFTYRSEEAEIHWTAELVRHIKQRLPEMPVCLSHPGFGVTGYDPVKWSDNTGVDFYSSHAYAGLCGADESIDFAAVTAATAAIIGARRVNFPGEWGILNSPAPADIRQRNHRDALWLSFLSGAIGFMQWEYDFPQEYRWLSRVLQALPADISWAQPTQSVEVGAEYRAFQDNTRYPAYTLDDWFSPWEFNQQKQKDPLLRQMLAVTQQALKDGVSVRFTMDATDSLSLEQALEFRGNVESQPVHAIGGYQLAYRHSANGSLWLGYLRSRQVKAFGGHYLGVPAAAPLTLKLNLPEGEYQLHLVNLSRNTVTRYSVTAAQHVEVSESTDDDYCFVIVGAGSSVELEAE